MIHGKKLSEFTEKPSERIEEFLQQHQDMAFGIKDLMQNLFDVNRKEITDKWTSPVERKYHLIRKVMNHLYAQRKVLRFKDRYAYRYHWA